MPLVAANPMIKKASEYFSDYPDAALSVALIMAAVVIVAIAVLSHDKLFKAIVLAYIILP